MAKEINRSLVRHTKDAIKRRCILKPMEADEKEITLKDGSNTIGRNKETGIRDVHCSKRQLNLDVNLDRMNIKLRVLGVNPCGVNGLMGMQNTECQLEHGDVLEILYGRHPYEVIFKPAPPRAEVDVTKKKKNETKKELSFESDISIGDLSSKTDMDMEDLEIQNNDIEIQNKVVKPETESKWDSIENGKMIVYTSAGVCASEKIAAYDIDGTIITTRSGNVFPKNLEDWQIIFAEVPKKLQALHQDGYKICFFTNQGGIAIGKVKLDDFKMKLKKIIDKLKIPVQVFVSISAGHYRKPLPGMWNYLEEHKNVGIQINKSKSFYVGDAAGRPEKPASAGVGKRKKDHSLADRYFAANIGISFYTPEEHFLNRKCEDWNKPQFEPSTVHDKVALFEIENVKIPADRCEMIIMVGLPGSGKSHFTSEHLGSLGYVIANADTLGSSQACLKACERTLNAGTSCVVDNTNVDVESRRKFIDLAKKLHIPCRCFVMNTSIDQIRHNIAFRQLTDSKHTKINDMVFNTMKKKYKQPTLEEGFTEIAKVNFKPKFNSQDEQRLYKLYLVEK